MKRKSPHYQLAVDCIERYWNHLILNFGLLHGIKIKSEVLKISGEYNEM